MMAQAAGLLPMMVNRAGTTSSAALILLALAGGQEHQLDEYFSKLLYGFLKAVTSISSPLPPRTGFGQEHQLDEEQDDELVNIITMMQNGFRCLDVTINNAYMLMSLLFTFLSPQKSFTYFFSLRN